MKLKGISLYPGDFCIVGIVIGLAIAIFLWMLPETAQETTLEVYLDGTLLHTIPLTEGVYTTLEVEDAVHNTIEIDGLHVHITQATCYDHVCENTGYISNVGEVIVCMPNKLLLKIVGNDTTTEFDAIVG